MPPIQAGNGNKVLYAVLIAAIGLLVAAGGEIIKGARADAVQDVRLDGIETSVDKINAKLDKILEKLP